MKKLIALATVVVALVGTTSAEAAYNVRFTGITVNPGRSATVNWWLSPESDNEVTENWSLTLDGRKVRDWSGGNSKVTTYTSPQLAPGSHTVTLETYTIFWSNKYHSSLNCDISQRDYYVWVCSYDETVTRRFDVGGSRPSQQAQPTVSNKCVVPDVVGLRLKDAVARLNQYGCKRGAVTQVSSKRGGGTVLKQKPEKNRRFTRGATVDLIIARY